MALSLKERIDHEVRELSLRHRVALIEDVGFPIVVRDAQSIVSTMPYVTLVYGAEEFRGRRRRRLFTSRNGKSLGVLARLRPSPVPPVAAKNTEFVVGSVQDARGRRHVVSAFDPRKRTLHLLLDLKTAHCLTVPDSSAEEPALAEALADALVGPALRHASRPGEPPSVGGAVDAHLQQLLERQAAHRLPRFDREIRMLRRAGLERTLPRALARRLRLLEKARRGDHRRKVDPEQVRGERERLIRLVESRACAAIRVHELEIRGLINPRAIDADRGHHALLFALRSAPAPVGPQLRIWKAGRPELGGARSMCLGLAADVIHSMEESTDAYGLVDTVLNFVETNLVGLVPRGEPAESRRRIFDYLF